MARTGYTRNEEAAGSILLGLPSSAQDLGSIPCNSWPYRMVVHRMQRYSDSVPWGTLRITPTVSRDLQNAGKCFWVTTGTRTVIEPESQHHLPGPTYTSFSRFRLI